MLLQLTVYNLQILNGTMYISHEIEHHIAFYHMLHFYIPTFHSKLGITVSPLALHRACCLAQLESELLPLIHNIC